MERIVNIGNVGYVEIVILFPFCLGVRHFSMRGFQEHTIRREIILKTCSFLSHCDLATTFDSKSDYSMKKRMRQFQSESAPMQ